MRAQAKLDTILRTGQIVAAKYRVDRLIAKGGMAAVWAGVNEHSGKRVALKVMLHSFAANCEAVELFRREALAASKVNHPNVVNIMDVIDLEASTCIVMEMLDGETFGSYLARDGPLSPESTFVLLLPAMRGVAAANAQGVVHRDLKPENIFLCGGSDGQWITSKVLDFGVSVMMKRAGEQAPVTELLAMFGTPAYMAPEAIEFSPDIDGRADVYGFGVLFFEALTGKLPFAGRPGLDLLRRILTDFAPKVTLYRPDLSSDVADLVDTALAKNPNDRFPDMDHLISATEHRLLALRPTPRARIPISGLAGEPLPAADGLDVAPGRKLWPASAVTRTRGKPISLPNSWRLLSRRTVLGAGLVAFLIAMAWVAIPASSSDSAVGPGQSSIPSQIAAPARGPLVTPLPSVPSPPLPEAPTREVLTIDRLAVDTAEPSIRVAAGPPAKRLSRGKSASPPSRTAHLPNQPFAARAGILSPSDF
jgi:serine/threonine protein kinase